MLDAACGEGYGTALLAAAGARSATGVDVDERSSRMPASRYPAADFVVGDVRELPFEDASFDLVVCFETIEHVDDPERVLSELDRVLAADGLLLVSTPNKHQYLVENEYHRREFIHEEFVELLQAVSPCGGLLQHNWLASAVVSVPLAGDESGERDLDLDFRKVVALEPGGELYTVALCGHGELPVVRGTAVASTVDEAHELAGERWRPSAQPRHGTRSTRGRSGRLHAVYESVWWRATPFRGGWWRSQGSGEVAEVVTVAIPVRNGGALLGDARRRHRTANRPTARAAGGGLRLDRRVAGARTHHGAELIDVPPDEFSHGGTRNLLAERPGSHIAFMTQDAVPADESWLARLLEGFGSADDVGLVFGPYRARAEASAMVRRELEEWFASLSDGGPPRPRVPSPGEPDVAATLLHRREWLRRARRLGAGAVPRGRLRRGSAARPRHARSRVREGLSAGRARHPFA